MKRILVMGAAAAILAACSDGTAPVTPGTLAVKSAAATQARAVMLRVTGPVTQVSVPAGKNYQVFSDTLAGDTTMIMVVAPAGTTLGSGPLALLSVPNVNVPGKYHVTPLQASGANNALLGGGGGFSLSVGVP